MATSASENTLTAAWTTPIPPSPSSSPMRYLFSKSSSSLMADLVSPGECRPGASRGRSHANAASSRQAKRDVARLSPSEQMRCTCEQNKEDDCARRHEGQEGRHAPLRGPCRRPVDEGWCSAFSTRCDGEW